MAKKRPGGNRAGATLDSYGTRPTYIHYNLSIMIVAEFGPHVNPTKRFAMAHSIVAGITG